MKLAKAEAFLKLMKGNRWRPRLGLAWSNWKKHETWNQSLWVWVVAMPLPGLVHSLSLLLFPCNVG